MFLKGHKKLGGKKKGSKSSYTIADLMDRLGRVEKAIQKQSGKPFDFLEFCIMEGIKGDLGMAKAILDRVCPIPKEKEEATTIVINNHIPGITETKKNG